jgi:spore photoproduct lyase
MSMYGSFKRLVIEREAMNDPLVSRVQAGLPGAEVVVTDDARALLRSEPSAPGSLVLMRHRGAFVKDFPATPGSPPCGEKYIVTMQNCPHACTYCYLQSYLDHSRIVLFTDTDRMKEEAARVIGGEAPRSITTGEMGDSLALDRLTGTTLELLPLFAGTRTLLEVRTKSAEVDHLLAENTGRTGAGNLVVTWTLGPEQMTAREEAGTAALSGRLSAIGRAVRAGVKVGVRFDPVIPFYADLEAYADLIGGIKRASGNNTIHRFEIGVLRFPPGLLEALRRRHPRSPLLRGEYFPDAEGKLRFYRPARIVLYREIARIIRTHFPDPVIELSMEDRSIWEDAGIELPRTTE